LKRYSKVMNKALTNQEINENLIKRLRYQSSHRGCKESDIILGKFAEEMLGGMDSEAVDIYANFLEESDSDIWDWLVEKTPCPKREYENLLAQIRLNLKDRV